MMPPSVDEKIRQVNERFLQKSIKIDFEWLKGCVQFFLEEDTSIPTQQLFQQAEEQWQLSDLSDSGVRCLPPIIFTEKKSHSVNGNFPLQLQYLIDISESAYDQLQKLQNKEVDVGKEQQEFKQQYQKNKKKRVLKIELTDGHQTVVALEYSPIPCLNTKLAPGTKILLMGPMRCVNHILFLDSKNIRIMGGEVGSMLVPNAFENVLLRELNQPLNPNPRTDYTEPAIVESYENSNSNRIPAIPLTSTSNNSATSSNHFNALDEFNDDDLLCEIDIDRIASTTTVPSLAPPPTPQQISEGHHNRCNSPSLFDDIDDNDFFQIDNAIVERAAANANLSASLHSTSNDRVTNNNNTRQSHQLTNDLPRQHCSTVFNHSINKDSKPNQISICDENYPFQIRGLNLVTIKQLDECSPARKYKRKYFIIKAEIDAIVESVKVSRDRKWSLGVLLTDDNAKNMLQVRFSSDVLEKLAGTSGRELYEMYALRNSRPQIANEIDSILKQMASELEKINKFMKIEFSPSLDYPVVVEIIDPAPVLERKLQEKIDREKFTV